MRIVIEAGDLLRPHQAGFARYVHCLLESLSADSGAGAIESWAPIRRLGYWLAAACRPRVRFFGPRPPRRLPAIFHATSRVFPSWKSRFEIATVHDLYIFSSDFFMPPEERWRRIAYISRADALICVSQHTRNDLHSFLNVPESRTCVIRLAPHPMFAPAPEQEKQRLRHKHALAQEFLLFVGRDRLNKNLDRLVEAYALTRLTTPLYLVGEHSKRTLQRLQRITDQRRCAGSLRSLGHVADEDLPALLSCASALCMPSTAEGFGLPILEAMACGTPVVTSSGIATEEAAGGHAVLVDPRCSESIAHGLIRSLSRSRVELDAARQYAASRTWKDVAAETWQVYRQYA